MIETILDVLNQEHYREIMLEDFLKRNNYLVTFDQFMEESLYGRRESFYEHVNIGKTSEGGHFVTSSQYPLFAELVSRHAMQAFDNGLPPLFIEMAGGMGTFKKNFLDHTQNSGKDIQYVSIDRSSHLLNLQAQHGGFNLNMSALETGFPDQSLEGVIFMNELVDAFPFKVIKAKREPFKLPTYEELAYGVNQRGDTQHYWINNNSQEIERYWDRQFNLLKERGFDPIWEFPETFVGAINLNEERLIKELARILKKGKVIIVDYGFTLSQETILEQDNFQTRVFPSEKTLPLSDLHKRIYQTDLTTNVNFSNVMRVAQESGFSIEYFGPQRYYLWQVVTTEEEGEVKEQGKAHRWYEDKFLLANPNKFRNYHALVLSK